MTRRYLAFGLLVLAQFMVPLHMIRSRENVLNEGQVFRFLTRPIDPVDPFQGRYVVLNIENDYVPCSVEQAEAVDHNRPGFATITTGSDGFAHFAEWSETRPATSAYLETRARGRAWDWDTPSDNQRNHLGLRIEIPFTRFYMNEDKAPQAEREAAEASRDKRCWVDVRVLNGVAVIEDVFVDGKSLRHIAAGGE